MCSYESGEYFIWLERDKMCQHQAFSSVREIYVVSAVTKQKEGKKDIGIQRMTYLVRFNKWMMEQGLDK